MPRDLQILVLGSPSTLSVKLFEFIYIILGQQFSYLSSNFLNLSTYFLTRHI